MIKPNQGTAVIVVGIDPHKQSHTALAISGITGEILGEVTVRARDAGHRRLVRWALGLGDQVPPRLMGQARRAGRERGKSDPIDAAAVARAALAHPELPAARLEGPELDLHLLLSHREDLVGERTRAQQRLRWHLHALDPEIAVPARALDRPAWLSPLRERLEAMGGTRARIAHELVADCARMSERINLLEREIARMVEAQAPELVAISGCGPLTAAKLVAEVAGIDRFQSAAKLARYAGVAPVPVSSGMRERHRLDRGGNRQLNCALHRIAITQARVHPPARDYLERRMAEGKTDREARRCLKRHLVNVIFRAMSGPNTTMSTGGEPSPAAALT